MDEEVKRLFTPRSMILFKTRKLSSYLVRAKLYPIEKLVGSFKYNKALCLAFVNMTATNTFTSITTGKSSIVTKFV